MIKPIAATVTGIALTACVAPGPWGERHPAASNGADGLRPPIALEAGGEVIDHSECSGHNGPHLADYDGDGVRDLGVGDIRGHFHVYRNTGTNETPTYAAGVLLEVDGQTARLHSW